MSNIDPSNPTQGQATTQSVRDNFQAAADEIDANAAAIIKLEPGGGGDFASYLAGYADTGLHTEYNGDIDAITVNSNYNIGASATGVVPTDWIPSNWGFLTTDLFSGGATNGTQTLLGMHLNNSYKVWMRSLESGVWTAWKLVVDGGAFTERLAGYRDNGVPEEYLSDLDLIIVNSAYVFRGDRVSNAPAGFPAEWATIVTFPYSISGVERYTQIIYGMNLTNRYKQWMRHATGGVWDAWVLVVDGNILSFAPTTANMILPTSAAGLSAGDLWNNLGVVNIV